MTKTQNFSTAQYETMDSIFRLCKAMDGSVSINDILNIMRMAVAEGSGMMAIQLKMASMAASMLYEERKGYGNA